MKDRSSRTASARDARSSPGAGARRRPPKYSRLIAANIGREVVRRAARIVRDAARAFAADSRDMPARGMRERKLPIEIAQLAGHAPAIHLPQQNGRGGLNHRDRSIAQNVGKSHARNVVPQAQGVREIGVGIQAPRGNAAGVPGIPGA